MKTSDQIQKLPTTSTNLHQKHQKTTAYFACDGIHKTKSGAREAWTLDLRTSVSSGTYALANFETRAGVNKRNQYAATRPERPRHSQRTEPMPVTQQGKTLSETGGEEQIEPLK